MRRRTSSVLVAALLVALVGGAAGMRPVASQTPAPAEALAAAVASLEATGYVARFTWVGESSTHGEVRFHSQLEYSLLVEDDQGAALEYVFVDPGLYARRRATANTAWSGWRRREWHPDLPVEGLVPYHPRLPLELLRWAVDLQITGVGRDETIEGRVSFFDALAASYEDEVAGVTRATVGTTLLPLSVRLDPAGAASEIVLHVTPPPSDPTPSSTLTYEFVPGPPAIVAPADAEEAESSPFLQPGPTQPAQTLPLTLRGSGRDVQAHFHSETGRFTARIVPAVSDVQYRLWRVKRGRQLLAGIGATTGGGGLVLPPLALPPGEYVLELVLPESVEWTVTIEPASP